MDDEITGMKTEAEEEVMNNSNDNPSITSTKKRKRKKKKKNVAPQENDNLNCNMICELNNSVTEDRPKDLQIPSIGNSVGCLKNIGHRNTDEIQKLSVTDEEDRPKDLQIPSIEKSVGCLKKTGQRNTDKKRKLSVTEEEDRPKDLQIPSIGKSVGCLKKLLVLDLNGLLADIVSYPYPKHIKRNAIVSNKAVFKRPFCSEFLNFCFEKFDVAVWSSRAEKNVKRIVNYLMGNMKERLIFCWSISQCTTTNIRTLENKRKVVVFKDLRKIWDKYDPNLPWEKGYYNESNTLLLDDSPYKGLLNPPYNSVFPCSFNHRCKKDNSLAVGGDLRRYLENLAKAEDMLKYVKQRPYGRKRISEKSKTWDFYVKILSMLQPKE